MKAFVAQIIYLAEGVSHDELHQAANKLGYRHFVIILAIIVAGGKARHLTLTVPLSAQVYKLVPANLMLGITLQ